MLHKCINLPFDLLFDVTFLMDHIDERQEQVPLQPIEIQVFWRPIRSNKHHNSVLHETLKQPFQDHGISDVQHLELIDEEERQVLDKSVACDLDRLARFASEFHVELVLHLVHQKHEFLVVKALLAFADVEALVEEFNHVGLARARFSVEVHRADGVES